MNLKHLETFAWCVRLGSFSAAARKLNTSQPAVSMRIQELERGLSVPLFERPRRASRLTPKGRELMEFADKILALASQAETSVGDARAVSGRVRVGVGETVALTWLPELVARLNERYPRLVIESDVDLTAGLWTKFRAGELELMLLPGPASGPGLVVEGLGTTLYTWMASPSLPLPARQVTPRDLESWPIITLSRDSVTHEITDRWFRAYRAEPRRIDVCNSLGVVVSLTMSGLGISLLPPDVFRREIERGELRVIDIEPRFDEIEFYSVYRHGHESSLVRVIAELARDVSTFNLPAADAASA